MEIDRKTRRRADKAREKIAEIVRTITDWRGERPTVVRVNHGDYLALLECGYVRDDKLSGDPHGLEVKPG